MAGNKKSKRVSAGKAKDARSGTPVVFRNAKRELDYLKLVPRFSLRAINKSFVEGVPYDANNPQHKQDLCTLYFRLSVGLYLSELFKEKDMVLSIKMLIVHLNDIRQGKEQYTDDVINLANRCLDYIDEFQNKTTRREQREAYLAVDKEMKEINFFN